VSQFANFKLRHYPLKTVAAVSAVTRLANILSLRDSAACGFLDCCAAHHLLYREAEEIERSPIAVYLRADSTARRILVTRRNVFVR
jgi:hypothetical protein